MSVSALVLAARRPGVTDPLAEKAGVSHKCLIEMDGVPMIELVLQSLAGSDRVRDIFVSIDDPSALDGVSAIHDGRLGKPVKIIQSAENLFESVRDALSGENRYPIIICTADNALQTAEMVDHFCAGFESADCDAAVALTPAEVIWAKYPDGQRRPYTFKDGKYSNCNLFGLRTPRSISAAQAFRGGGQFGKSKARIFKAFGLVNLLLYNFTLVSLSGVFDRLSRRFRVKVVPIIMPFAEAPIDVDNERTERIARRVLAERRGLAAE
ncbi:nucleotidyltransferase family protein [uncultured Algimonas sp.]|uniref:nucleotidyltransferase family protein n=1 Tax=uncultured Algimonas sp. TaxID=1547920 RepID=UPI002621C96C|nr:nucleotidyltransferase family protein [uncultured Algimonas sp.]